MSEIKVTFGELQNLASQIQSKSQAVEQELEDLKSQIAQLDTLWQGSAQAGYQQTKTAWYQAAEDLNATLAKIGVAVNAAEQAYSETESRNTAAWG